MRRNVLEAGLTFRRRANASEDLISRNRGAMPNRTVGMPETIMAILLQYILHSKTISFSVKMVAIK
jgi:hypothetical protein